MRSREEGTCPGALDCSRTAGRKCQALTKEAGAKLVGPGKPWRSRGGQKVRGDKEAQIQAGGQNGYNHLSSQDHTRRNPQT